MRNNEALSNRAYFHPSNRNTFHSPQQRLLKISECRSPDAPANRFYQQSKEFEALQSNIHNTLSIKLKR